MLNYRVMLHVVYNSALSGANNEVSELAIRSGEDSDGLDAGNDVHMPNVNTRRRNRRRLGRSEMRGFPCHRDWR